MKPLEISLTVCLAEENKYKIKYVVNGMEEALINTGGDWCVDTPTLFYKDETKNMCILSSSFPEIRVFQVIDESHDNYKLLLFVLGGVKWRRRNSMRSGTYRLAKARLLIRGSDEEVE